MTTLPADQAQFAVSSRTEYEAAIERLREASQAYEKGVSVLDDASYDHLRRSVKAWEEENPGEVSPDSPIGLVADGAVPGGDIAHTTPLLSLNNAFDANDLVKWGASLHGR
ncbi:NAD-dependent DNA ligase LigA, partial [Streptomyces sp. WAC02707]